MLADIVAIVDNFQPVKRIVHTKNGNEQIMEFIVTNLM